MVNKTQTDPFDFVVENETSSSPGLFLRPAEGRGGLTYPRHYKYPPIMSGKLLGAYK